MKYIDFQKLTGRKNLKSYLSSRLEQVY